MYDSEVSKYVIYKFQWLIKKRERVPFILTKDELERIDKEMEFKKAFINKFSDENIEEIFKYTFLNKFLNEHPPLHPNENWKIVPYVEYSKTFLHNDYEIGLDMLGKKYGIITGIFRSNSWYLWVPKKHTEMVEWVNENKPDFVTIKKRI